MEQRVRGRRGGLENDWLMEEEGKCSEMISCADKMRL